MKNKKQHWVARSYLAAWCDPQTPKGEEPYAWIFPKDGGEARRKAPGNLFHEADMYTIKAADGVRDLRLEHGLSGLEADFASLRRNVLAKRVELTPQDRLVVCAFVAATQARTRRQRDHFRTMWSGVLADMEAIRREMLKKAPVERHRIAKIMSPSTSRSEASLGYEEVKRLADAPLQHMLDGVVSTQIPILYGMDLAVLSTDDTLGFIASDAPCAWFDPEANKRPFLYRAPGLAWPTIEVTLPISPSQLVLINRAGLAGYYKISLLVVDELNRRTRAHADTHFVVCRDETRPIWYELGEPPGATAIPLTPAR